MNTISTPQEQDLRQKRSSLPKILCIADGPNWIFNRHILYLRKYLGERFQFSTTYRGQPYNEEDYDLIYPLEFNMVSPDQIKSPQKYVTGIRSFVAWADWDFLVLVNFLVTHFQSIHVVSRQLHDIFVPYIPGVCYVTHGIDTDFFKPPALLLGGTGQLRLGWAGNRGTYVKGFRAFIEPLASIPGVSLVFNGISDRNLPYEEMPGFYQSIDAYICASSFEGNNNSLLEAAAMERAIITTRNGTVPEYLQDRKNALLVDRDLNQFISAVERLRDDPQLRLFLGKRARESVVQGGWDWKHKAEEYGAFFNNAIARSRQPLPNRLVIDPPDLRHYAEVLQTQYRLERDLRIGHAYQGIELQGKVTALEGELAGIQKELANMYDELVKIKRTYAYRIDTRINALKLSRPIRQMFDKLKR